jgi:hypothetical protein
MSTSSQLKNPGLGVVVSKFTTRVLCYLAVTIPVTFFFSSKFQELGDANRPIITTEGFLVNLLATASFCAVIAILGGADRVSILGASIISKLFFWVELGAPVQTLIEEKGEADGVATYDSNKRALHYAGILTLLLVAVVVDCAWYFSTRKWIGGSGLAFGVDSIVIAELMSSLHLISALLDPVQRGLLKLTGFLKTPWTMLSTVASLPIRLGQSASRTVTSVFNRKTSSDSDESEGDTPSNQDN